MPVEKFWMIVDISVQQSHFNDQLIPRYKAPRFMHENEDSAERECLRLAREHPDGEFVVLESTLYAKHVSNEWANITKKDPVKSICLEECVPFEEEIPF